MTELNKVEGLVAGQYGEAVSLQVVDDDGQPVDLSAYTAAILRAISDDAQETSQFACTITSATGGTFTFTPDTTNNFIRPGTWEAQVQFSDTGVLALTVPFQIIVEKQI